MASQVLFLSEANDTASYDLLNPETDGRACQDLLMLEARVPLSLALVSGGRNKAWETAQGHTGGK